METLAPVRPTQTKIEILNHTRAKIEMLNLPQNRILQRLQTAVKSGSMRDPLSAHSRMHHRHNR